MQQLKTPIVAVVLGGTLICFMLLAGAGEASAADLQQKKVCSQLSEPGHYPDYERLPVFKVERKEFDASKPPILLLRITIPPDEMAKASMARLACKLIDDFGQNSSVDALVFDNEPAAKNLAVGFPEQTNYGEYLWHLRAHFQWNVNSKEGEMRYVIPDLRDDLLSLDAVSISILR